MPAELRYRRAQDALMGSQDGRVVPAQLLQQARRAFDIGEEQGDGPARQPGHTTSLWTTPDFVGEPLHFPYVDIRCRRRNSTASGYAFSLFLSLAI